MKTVFLLLLLSLVAVASTSEVAFKSFCPRIRFNYDVKKYEITVPVKAGPEDSGVEVVQSGNRVRLLCKTYDRCWQLKDALASKPELLPQSLAFLGKDEDSQNSRAYSLPADGLVKSDCNSGWKVFLRRVDGSLSFVKNFKAYERGFGKPNGNFWMGLHNLHAATGAHKSGCRLRVRAVGNDGKKYKAKYTTFRVGDKKSGYKLRIGGPAKSNTIYSIEYPNGLRFSAFDVDRDTYKASSCSKTYGSGGWWFGNCHAFNPTGTYTTRNLSKDPTYACISVMGRGYQTIRSILMEYKCE